MEEVIYIICVGQFDSKFDVNVNSALARASLLVCVYVCAGVGGYCMCVHCVQCVYSVCTVCACVCMYVCVYVYV